jgi:hypothetical protein
MARVGTWGRDTEHSWARIVIVFNAILYTLIGLSLPAAAVAAQWHLVIAAFAILLASRLLPVYVFGFETPAHGGCWSGGAACEGPFQSRWPRRPPGPAGSALPSR